MSVRQSAGERERENGLLKLNAVKTHARPLLSKPPIRTYAINPENRPFRVQFLPHGIRKTPRGERGKGRGERGPAEGREGEGRETGGRGGLSSDIPPALALRQCQHRFCLLHPTSETFDASRRKLGSSFFLSPSPPSLAEAQANGGESDVYLVIERWGGEGGGEGGGRGHGGGK